jgi:hypothetical protein
MNNRNILIIITVVLIGIFAVALIDTNKKTSADKLSDSLSDVVDSAGEGAKEFREEVKDEIDDNTKEK